MACEIKPEVGAQAPDQLDPEQSADGFGQLLVVFLTVGDLADLLAIKEEQLRDTRRNQLLQKVVPLFPGN